MGRAVLVVVVVVGSPPVLSIRKWRKEIRNQNAAYYSFFVTVRNTSAMQQLHFCLKRLKDGLLISFNINIGFKSEPYDKVSR